MTLSETIRTLESLALQQQSVAMVIQNDVFKLNTIPNAKYAVFAYSQGQHLTSVSGDLATYRLTLFYVDRLLADKSNQTDIQSTGTQVLRNILTMMSELDFDVDSMPIQPFTQQFVDECAGVYCAVSIGAANGCECMPGFTEMFHRMDKAIANTNAAADRANDIANHPPKIVEVDGELFWAFWDEDTQNYVTSKYNADSSGVFSTLGQSIVTGTGEESVTTDEQTVTVNLTRRTRDTAAGDFGNDEPLPVQLPGATQEAAGVMSAADKAKVDNMAQDIDNALTSAKAYTDGEVAKEASARESADTTLQQNITAEQTRAEGQESAIRSEFASADAANLGSAKEFTTNAVATHNTSDTAHADIRTLLASCTGLPTYDPATYKLTFQTNNGQQLEVDLPIEQMDLRYNPETQSIEFDNGDGGVSSIPVSEFITEYSGSNGTEIVVTIGAGNTIQASIVGNSIAWEKLTLALQQKINDKADTTYVNDQIGVETSDRKAADAVLQDEIDGKLSIETYNADKSTFATKAEIGDINSILDEINGEVI